MQSPEASALVTVWTEDSGIVMQNELPHLTGGKGSGGSIEVLAVEEGTWGDRISVEILEGSLDPEDGFNLVVRYKGEVVEIFKDLSLSESSARYVEMIVNERSEFVTVEVLDPLSILKCY